MNMLTGAVQMAGEKLSRVDVKEICESLKQHSLNLLSLRGCTVDDDGFMRLMRAVGKTKSLQQFNLNLGPLINYERVMMLSDALNINRSIRSLYLHGCPLEDKGIAILIKALSLHPSIVDLDIGDCLLGDTSIKLICNLLPPDGAKSGLHELVLSANTAITKHGWSMLFCAIAASSCLQSLIIDYNPAIGDAGAKMLAVVVAGSQTLTTLDLEGCGLSDAAAKVFIELLESYPTPLHELVLAGNGISDKLQEDVAGCLHQLEK